MSRVPRRAKLLLSRLGVSLALRPWRICLLTPTVRLAWTHEGVPEGWQLLPFQGWRSAKEQERLFREGRTRLRRSKHNLTPARACDVVWWHPVKGWSWDGSLPWHLVGSSAKAHGLQRRGAALRGRGHLV